MSLKIYTVTVDGNDNRNVIAQPFTIEVHQVGSVSEGSGETLSEFTQVRVCTKNAVGMCNNSDIPDSNNYELQTASKSRTAMLTATIEVDLDAVYGSGNWN